jgi:formate dehydrogenase assembly factor FdhD
MFYYFDDENLEVLNSLIMECEDLADGHLTIMKFTTNFRACFGTPRSPEDIEKMAVGYTMEEAIIGAVYKFLQETPKEKRNTDIR